MKETLTKSTNVVGIDLEMDSKQIETRKKPQVSKKHVGARKRQNKAAEQPKCV